MAQQCAGNDNGAGATTIFVDLTTPSSTGDCLGLIIGQYGGARVTGVTDDKGQTYVLAETPGANSEHPSAWVFPNSVSGVVRITATFSVSSASSAIAYAEPGIVTASPVDVGAHSAASSAAAWDTTATASMSQNDGVGYAYAVSTSGSNRAFTANSPYIAVTGTGITAGHHGNATDGNDLFVSRRVITAGGAQQATGTCTAASLQAAAIHVLKTAATDTLMGASAQ